MASPNRCQELLQSIKEKWKQAASHEEWIREAGEDVRKLLGEEECYGGLVLFRCKKLAEGDFSGFPGRGANKFHFKYSGAKLRAWKKALKSLGYLIDSNRDAPGDQKQRYQGLWTEVYYYFLEKNNDEIPRVCTYDPKKATVENWIWTITDQCLITRGNRARRQMQRKSSLSKASPASKTANLSPKVFIDGEREAFLLAYYGEKPKREVKNHIGMARYESLEFCFEKMSDQHKTLLYLLIVEDLIQEDVIGEMEERGFNGPTSRSGVSHMKSTALENWNECLQEQ